MKNSFPFTRLINLLIVFSFLLCTSKPMAAATDTLGTGSFIINMGATNPNTIANGLKPYGMVYDLVKNHYVAVKWVISQTKAKDGKDFTYNGTDYKGGTFIIPAAFRNAAVDARIAYWQGQGVVGNTTTSPLVVDVTYNINAVPTWTLDAQNGSKAEAYLLAAGINLTDFPTSYNWKTPGALDCCNDLFVMPHADPAWASHGNLYNWNLTCNGAIWAACHAVSALENMVNPANRNQQTNFLTRKVAGLQGTSGDYAESNSLILWGDHDGGSIPYVHQYPNDPIAQYIGATDAGQQNGSEQIYVPNQAATGGYNPGAKLITYDPTHSDVTILRPDKLNAAAAIVYGRGFDDPNRGYVMYEGGHSHAGSAGPNVAAQRAFLNFSLFTTLEKVPTLFTNTIPATINGGATTAPFNMMVTALAPQGPYTYQWVSSCGGSFSNATGTFANDVDAVTATSTTFTAPPAPTTSFSCAVTCIITDACGRQVAESRTPVILSLPVPPVANTDYTSTTPGTMATISPLNNDTDGNLDPLTITGIGPTGTSNSITTANGQFVTGPNNTVLYLPNPGFEGTDSVMYTTCDPGPLCDTSFIYVVVAPYFGPCGLGKTQVFVGTGGAVVTSSIVAVSNPAKALGPTDGDAAEFDKTGTATMTVDLGQTYNIGDTIKFKMASKSNGKLVTFKVEGGATSSITFSGAAVDFSSSTQVYADYEFVVAVANTKFLKFQQTTTVEKGRLESIFIEVNDCVADCPNGFSAVVSAKYAPTIFSFTGVGNQTDIIGSPDNSFAKFNGSSDEMIIDLGEVRPAGTVLGFYVISGDNVLSEVDVSGSVTSGGTYSGTATLSYASNEVTTLIPYEIPAGGAQFIKINNWVSANNKDFLIDAIKFVAIDCENVTPVALLDTVTVCEDNPIVINPTPNDIDPLGGALTLTIVSGPSNGLAAISANNTISYTPANDYAGTDSIEYKVCNSAGYCGFTKVKIGVIDDGCTSGNFVPTAAPPAVTDSVYATEDTYIDEDNAGKNFGATTTLGIESESGKTKYTLLKITPTSIPVGATITSAKLVMVTSTNKLGSIDVYRMTNDWVEGAQDNGNGSTTDPTWDNREEGTPTPWTSGVGADGDYDANNIYATAAVPSTTGARVEWDITTLVQGWHGGLSNKGLFLKRTTANNDLNLFYSSENGTITNRPRIVYTYTTTSCAGTCVPIPNRPPVAGNSDTCTQYNSAVTINVANNVTDPDAIATYGLDTNTVTVLSGYLGFPNSGSATASGGSITYTPALNSLKKDTVFFSIADSLGLKDTAMLVICINGVPITAVNDNSTTVSGTPDTIDVASNDIDPLNGTLTVSPDPSVPPANGTVTVVGGQLVYTPNPGFTGTDSFQYTVCNQNFPPSCDVAIVYMTVTNQTPTPVNDSVVTAACVPITIAVLDNDGDPEGNNLTVISIAAVNPTSAGTAILSGNNIIFTPSSTFSGTALIPYTVQDDGVFPLQSFANAVVTAGTSPVNNPPNAVRDTFDIFVNETLYADILTNDSEPDGDLMTKPVIITQGTQGSAVILNNGLLKYTPTGISFVGYDSVQYQICDSSASVPTGCTFAPKCDTAWMLVELLFLESPAIGVAKEVTNQVDNNDGTHNITYTIKIRNFGNVAMNNVQVSDTLTNTFPSPVTYAMVGTPTSSSLSVNTAFDGTVANANLLAVNQNLAIGDSASVSFTVKVTPTATDTFNNTALASGRSPNGNFVVNDSSNNGNNTDPDNNLDPTDNNIPTPVILNFVTVEPLPENGTVTSLGGTAIPSVLSNDSVNGSPASTGPTGNSTITQSGTWPTGITLDTASGAINVATGTPPGTYPVTYELCDKASPTPNCATVVDTIFVTPSIDPDPENGTVTSLGGTAIPNVTTNDSTNGVPTTLGPTGNSTISQSGTWPTGITLDTTNGSVNVAPGTTPGSYPVTYQLCDTLTPQTCATVVDTITVTPVIDPETENGTVTSALGGTAISNVTSNDSVNGVAAVLGTNATVSQSGTWPTGISLNTTSGSIDVAPGTPPGSYPVTYQLCDTLTPQSCATVIDTIFVTPVIDPETENGTVTAAAGGTAISNVTSNDSVNGAPSTLGALGNSTVAQSGTWPTGISLDTLTGAVNVVPGTAVGAYPVTYQLCDKLTPVTCATVVDTIFVTPVIDPETENGTVTAAAGGTAITNVAANDSTNGAPSTLGALGNSTVAQSGTWPTGISLDTLTGAVNVVPGTAVGAYPVTYQLCDKLTPVTCATVVDTIFVTPVIDPETENGTVTAAAGGTAISNVTSNDSVNGAPSTLGALGNSTVAQSGTWPTGISLDTLTGAVNVVPGTTPGAYPVTYQLCDKLTPVTCATVVDTIFVTPSIDPDPENGTVTALGGTAIPNVTTNDSTNGVPTTLGPTGNSTISQSGTWPTGITLDTTNGSVNVAPGTTPGSYPVTYQLCDTLTPQTCATVVDTITVTPVIDPETENGTVTSALGGTAISNVTSNDSVNGVAAVLGTNATVSQSGTWPTGISLNSTSGSIDVAPGTPPGAYPVTYELCDVASPTPNCATVVDTIFVTPSIDPDPENGTVTALGGTAIPNVTTNDSTNGVPTTLGPTGNSTISQSGTWPTGISLDTTNGSVNVAPGTLAGSYPVTYELCDTISPIPNCATVIDTVHVTPVADTVTTPVPSCPTCPLPPICATQDNIDTTGGGTTYTTCGTPSGYTVSGPDANGCLTFTGDGTADGITDTSCVVACKNGICDTTYILIPPPVKSDTVTTPVPSCPTCPLPPICATQDDIDTTGGGTTYTTCGTPSGYTVSGPDANGCLTFTGDGTADGITDTSCVVACKNGICDTTYIFIPPPVKPDTLYVTPLCDTCSTTPVCATADDLPIGASTTSYTSCGLVPASMGTQVLDTLTGCIVFTGNGLQGPNDTVTSCVIACKDGVCDTTYISILPPPAPDLTPVITIYPSITHGIQNIQGVVDVYEISNIVTSSPITLYLSKDTRYVINFDSTATTVAGRAVNNSSWTFDAQSNPLFYIFTTNTVMPGFSVLNFGYDFTFNPFSSAGSTTINVIIIPGSGDEDNFNNNSDDTTFDYFIN